MIRADNRRLRGDLNKSRKMFGKTFTKIGKGIRGKLSGALGGLGGLAAGLGVAAIAKDVLDFEETLTRLGIQAGTSASDDSISGLPPECRLTQPPGKSPSPSGINSGLCE